MRTVTDFGPSGQRIGQYALDLTADAAALQVLNRIGVGVLSEESGYNPGTSGEVVVIDPIDGSTNASRGIQWFDPQAFVNPSLYTFGNVPRSISSVRQPAAFIVNLSAFKTFQLREKVKLQFRAEAFNAPNHTNYAAANGSFTAGANGLNANDSFGRIIGARDPRRMQFALKFLF